MNPSDSKAPRNVYRTFTPRTRGKSFLPLAVVALCLSCAPVCNGAGVTIITHGWNSEATTGWVNEMAGAIFVDPRFHYDDITLYRVCITESGDAYLVSLCDDPLGTSPLVSDSAEILIELDWSTIDTFDALFQPDAYTSSIAAYVAAKLIDPNFIPELGKALTELPIHLIGHSRGGALVTQIAYYLGTQGVWVDQVTTLDPHPLAYDDAFLPMAIYDNVLFADNYYETETFWPPVPHGEQIDGAANRYLSNLSGGYGGPIGPHSDVHLWYHGTIDLETPASDGEASVTSEERDNWWTSGEEMGAATGFHFSRISGGTMTGGTRINAATGLRAVGASREPVNATVFDEERWDNVEIDYFSPNSVQQGDTFQAIVYWEDLNRDATIEIGLDADANPYNGFAGSPLYTQGTAGSLAPIVAVIGTSSVTPDTYHVYAKISNGTHTRYYYAQEKLNVLDTGELPPPSAVSASDGSFSDKVMISWNAVSGATGYNVYRNTANDTNNADKIFSTGLGVTSGDDTAVTAGITYYYWVKAKTTNTVSAFSSPDTGHAGCIPLVVAPSGISATDGSFPDKVVVIWNAVTGAAGYDVWRNTANDTTSAVKIFSTGTGVTSGEDTGAIPGTTYYYWAKAKNSCGTSGFSVADTGFSGCVVPVGPSSVSASDGTYSNKVTISWSGVTGATGYDVWRNTASDSGTATKIFSTGAGVIGGDDTEVTQGTTYWYWVKAKNSCATSEFSNPDTGFAACLVPSTPAGVSASDGTYTNKVTITWNTVTDATGYDVWRNTMNDTNAASKIFSTGDGVTNGDDNAVTGGTTYYYWVKSKNACGTSQFSSSDSGYAHSQHSTNAVGHWPLDGDTSDASGNGNNGTIFGPSTFTTGRCGDANTAFSFDGVSNYISVVRMVSNDFTVCFWMKTTATGPDATEFYSAAGLIDNEKPFGNKDWGVGFTRSNVIFGINNETNVLSTSTVNDGTWKFVVAVRDAGNSNISLFINGNMETSRPASGGSLTGQSSIWFGKVHDTTNEPKAHPYFSGLMDDVQIYDRVLSPSEILALYDPCETDPPPAASFTGSPTNGLVSLSVTFTDNSTGNITNRHWNFGDGTQSNMTATTFAHHYVSVGTNTISLTVFGPGGSNTLTRTNYIIVTNYPPPVADFSAAPTNGAVPLLVHFTNLTTGNVTSYLWNFGDDSSSAVSDPTHGYGSTGLFTVALSAFGPGGTNTKTKSNYITVTNEPPPPVAAEFAGSPTNGSAPLSVEFDSSASTGVITNRHWNFGDGSTTNTSITSVNHSYTNAGVRTVTLIVSGPGGSSTNTKPNYITVTNEPTPCDLPEAVDATDLAWSNTSWMCQNEVTHDGEDAARSGAIGHITNSWFQTTVTGPGTIRFWWKVSSQTNADYLAFYIGGAIQTEISGEVDWNQKTLFVPAGPQTLRWEYEKNASGTSGEDAAFVDEIEWVPANDTEQPAPQAAKPKSKAKCKDNACTLTASFKLENGNTSTFGPKTAYLFLSDDKAFDASDTELPFSQSLTIPPGGKAKVKAKKIAVPDEISVSGKFVLLVCDPEGSPVVLAVYGPLP